ncbi:MAG: DUF4097 family beta strand repeat-containing protein [Pseudomonadota bacterium]
MYQRILTTALLVALTAPAAAGWDDADYTQKRELSIETQGLDRLMIDAGAGRLEVRGVNGSDRIVVDATILVFGADGDRALRYIEEEMRLTLEKNNGRAVLMAGFDSGMGFNNRSGAIQLEISVPKGLELDIDKGSGETVIEGTAANIRIDDGSGSLQIRDVGNLVVDDGSGSLRISDVSGDVEIDDGSGSIKVDRVTGSVTVDDGSGSVRVRDVGGDFIVIDDGSGSVNYSNVAGRVEIDD